VIPNHERVVGPFYGRLKIFLVFRTGDESFEPWRGCYSDCDKERLTSSAFSMPNPQSCGLATKSSCRKTRKVATRVGHSRSRDPCSTMSRVVALLAWSGCVSKVEARPGGNSLMPRRAKKKLTPPFNGRLFVSSASKDERPSDRIESILVDLCPMSRQVARQIAQSVLWSPATIHPGNLP